MSGNWRAWAMTASGLVGVCGVALWASGGGPVVFILGALGLVTCFLEPIYGQLVRRPLGGSWKPTEERFVDPETGKLVTVWFDPTSGERRYVTNGQSERP